MSRLLRLEAAGVAVLLEFESGQMPVWRYWGAALGPTPLLYRASGHLHRRRNYCV